MNRRVLWIVLDSVGAGALPDAAAYGDAGANTLGHIQEKIGLNIPNMRTMGLGNLPGIGIPGIGHPSGAFGRACERSKGKDTTTGHWEIAGLTSLKPMPTFSSGFPESFIQMKR